jgi:hypothetical protein
MSVFSAVMPLAFAQTAASSGTTANSGLVPCGTGSATDIATTYDPSKPNSANGCNFQAFVILVKNVTNYLILLSAPIVVIIMVWAGWQYLISQGSSEKVKRVKGVIGNTALAFLFILGGWLLVHLVASALLSSSYNIFNI